ncbi:MAG TPA: hypothetical protein PLZ58_00050 [Candidatus Saccharibacteria bacterium]|nr:hypothetical protein [Candidatus Saccharibacteria bacterium]HRQ07286.1 hypothetical protein [Candidatus Saccharibacteria bacterium]
MKRAVVVIISIVALLIVAFSSQSNPETSSSVTNKATNSSNITQPVPKKKPVCDGTTVTSDCTVDGISYSTYIYHPTVPEKSHTETVTTYEKEVVGYCTLCNDGTYSPSCATGRGACSHHGGVAQWNAPRYSSVPKTSTKTIIDSPAKEAYYEKVLE